MIRLDNIITPDRIIIDISKCSICKSIIEEIAREDDYEDKYWKAEELTDHWSHHSSVLHQITKQVWSFPASALMCETPNCPNKKISHSRFCMDCIRSRVITAP